MFPLHIYGVNGVCADGIVRYNSLENALRIGRLLVDYGRATKAVITSADFTQTLGTIEPE